jgi:putative transposase
LLETDEYLLACYRYIELNPVRAGVVSSPADYRWSSHRCNALGEPDILVTPHDLYLQLGGSESQRCPAYLAFFHREADIGMVESIREATNKALVLGNERFRREVEDLLQRQAAPKSRGGDRKSVLWRNRGRINRV